MAKRELDTPEAGTGDRIAYDPTVNTATTVTSTTPEITVRGKEEVFKMIEARWPMFEKLAAETKANKARRKFDGLWSELGRNIVDRNIIALPQRNQNPGRATSKSKKKKAKKEI